MTLYVYKCSDESCEMEQEVEHSMKESPTIACDVCGGPTFRVVTGGSGYILKGRTGGRVGGGKDDSWGWGQSRANPSMGHKLTEDDRRAREAEVIGKFEKQIDNYKGPEEQSKPAGKVISDAMSKIAERPKKLVV